MIRILQESDAAAYQQVRLMGLRSDPDAFGSTYDREAGYSIEMVAERIKPDVNKFVLGAFDADHLLGVVTFVRDSGIKTRHKGLVFAMYVRSENRGHGIGRRLMDELIQKAKEIEGVEQINLTVVSSNVTAKKMYVSLGFEVFGSERNALKYEGRYFDEDFMVLRL